MNAAALAAWQAKCPPLPETPMPHVSQMFSSKYLTKEDCAHKPVVTITDCKAETFQQFGARGGATGSQPRWILYFREANKGLKLNATIIKVLAAAFGEHSEQWIGKRVMLYVDNTVMMAGQVVGGIRIQPPRGVPAEVGFQTPGAFKEPSADVAIPAGARFDPMTGAPLAQPPSPSAAFNPQTGEVLQRGAPTGAPTSKVDPEFDDPVPF